MSSPGELRAFSQFADRDQRLVQIVDAALADAALRAGDHLVCRPGCTQCCHGAFAITPLDAMRLRAGMLELNRVNPDLARRIETRAKQYLEEFGESLPGNSATGVLGQSEAELEAFDDFANEAACPALNPGTGLCDIYDARPIACRVFGPPVRANVEPEPWPESDESSSFAVCELCFTDATAEEVEACAMKVPREEERRVLEELEHESGIVYGETIVAYCLLL